MTHWQWTPGHVAQTLVDVLALLPAAGSLKYLDNAGTLVKSGLPELKFGLGIVSGAGKNLDNVTELAVNGAKHSDAAKRLAESLLQNGADDLEKSATDIGKITNKATEGAGNAGKIPWDSWDNYEKVSAHGQEYAKVGDRLYSKHAVDRMQPSGKRFTVGDAIVQAGGVSGRSVAPQFVEDVISSVKPVFQPATGNYIYSSGTVKIVTNEYGHVVTIMTVGW